jgi:hypothetical protein
MSSNGFGLVGPVVLAVRRPVAGFLAVVPPWADPDALLGFLGALSGFFCVVAIVELP